MVIESAFFWMGAKKEAKVNFYMDQHMDIVLEAVVELNKATRCFSKDKCDHPLIDHTKKVISLENKADKHFRELTMTIANSLLPSGEKRDFMDVLIHVERIAEFAERAAKTLYLGRKLEFDEEYNTLLHKMADATLECVKEVHNVAEEHKDFTKMMNNTNKVTDDKNAVENIKMDILEKVFTEQNLTVTQEFFLREMIHSLEHISDASEDCVDTFRIIGIKR